MRIKLPDYGPTVSFLVSVRIWLVVFVLMLTMHTHTHVHTGRGGDP